MSISYLEVVATPRENLSYYLELSELSNFYGTITFRPKKALFKI